MPRDQDGQRWTETGDQMKMDKDRETESETGNHA